MRCPTITQDESARLRALAEYGLSSERGLASLDPIVDMAALMFNCPTSAVNMIGEDRVYLVSRHGIDEFNDTRDVSFCAHAINQDGVMVVEDATLDVRFHDNPLVQDGAIVFYAGVPIVSPTGHALGALCVIDNQPHAQFSQEDRARLKELAKLVSERLELRRIEAAGEPGANRLQASAQTSPNAILAFDSNSRITAWNAAAAGMFGRSADDAIGQSVDLLIAPEDLPLVHDGIVRVLAGGSPANAATELTGLRRNGQSFPGELHWSRWLEGERMHFGAIIRDMTDKRREQDALYRLANYDTLTGLPNSNLLYRRITEALDQDRPLALVVADLERFRDINNTLGHAAGDRVLRIVAERIRQATPRADGDTAMVARIGSDEFAILLPGEGDPVRIGQIIGGINEVLSEPIVVDGQEVRIGGNFGIALAPDHGCSVEEVMASANLAVFQARSSGPGGTFLFHPRLRAEAVARRMYDAELHRAFERSEFTLFYQPLIRLADNSLAGAEALIRWRHPKRGLLAPIAFLPALENSVLAAAIGQWVLETACSQAAEWRRLAPDFRVNVNLFAAQFRDGTLPQLVSDTLSAYSLPPEALDLEITENIILDRQDAVLGQLGELREAGFSLSFDDFGTGFASLNLLRNFPVTSIKIDKSFIQVMHSSPKDRAIVLSLIDLARQLGLKVVAEGVETDQDRTFLLTHGCETGQGYLFGTPAPAALFEEQFLGGSGIAKIA
ncbi:MAG: EAL domain-containing protein [Candidatus Andeanibacterium colombiense]|uniref:EAL domain-containing protein n=1 Tax=Candidatus Andeanibacterium colombiense TaxID=3121345 RepID=A0AAJ5X874_9SPHN|nr:MAG: EAL domain-containing protein [Sphingomonadaceae bacterium]